MSETSFSAYCRELDYKEFDATALKDGAVVKIGAHTFFKVSKLGGWVSYTGNIHTNEDFAQIAKSRFDTIWVYA
jgi:hypothetical protein